MLQRSNDTVIHKTTTLHHHQQQQQQKQPNNKVKQIKSIIIYSQITAVENKEYINDNQTGTNSYVAKRGKKTTRNDNSLLQHCKR